MDLFGKVLVDRGVLSSAQLDEATQSQVIFGGRLGTNLVELGYLRLDDLERLLSEHLGIPVAPTDWVETPERSALAHVSRDLAQRHGLLPLRVEKRTLHLAMLDPRDPRGSDDVGFATGLRLQPYVMAEVRLSALLEHHYGIPRDTRYIDLGIEAARGRRSKQNGGTAASGSAPPGDAPTLEDHRALLRAEELVMQPLDDGQDLIDEQTFSTLHQSIGETWKASPPAKPQPVATSAVTPTAAETPGQEPEAVAGPDLPAAALEALLTRASDRDTVSGLALRIARMETRAAALFVVRGGVISGQRGDDHEISARLDGILLPADAPSVFARAVTSAAACISRAPFRGIDARVQEALRRGDTAEILVVPIVIRDRVVNLLYADNGSAPIGDIAAAALSALAGCVAAAYQRLILERKRSLERPS